MIGRRCGEYCVVAPSKATRSVLWCVGVVVVVLFEEECIGRT
jgi:hypothetical protein